MTTYTITKQDKTINGELTLVGSKSIANRALIIRALCETDFPIHAMAASKDTETLIALLDRFKQADPQEAITLDAGPAGTTYRFMTAFLAMQPGTQILTGSERMKQRPIGVLVEALKELGAAIEYMEKEGYPPLKIHAPQPTKQNKLSISASTSSQYISALLMIAPTLPKGLELTLEGKIVSRPYIEMTLNLMRHFGAVYSWDGHTITVQPKPYIPKVFTVEADWSAASYHYAMAAIADEADLQIHGLQRDSVQGDAILARMMRSFGVQTTYNETGIRLTKSGDDPQPIFEYDFLLCPDLAQTLAVVCGALGVQGLFTGLETLRIKETDRIAALKTELAKVQVYFSKLPPHFSKKNPEKEFHMIEGKAEVKGSPIFDTYEDHRMAMAFAPLAMLGEIKIEEPMVVVKSYPNFYEDLELLGFEVDRG